MFVIVLKNQIPFRICVVINAKSWKEVAWPNITFYSDIFSVRMGKTMKHLSQDIQSPGPGLNQGFSHILSRRANHSTVTRSAFTNSKVYPGRNTNHSNNIYILFRVLHSLIQKGCGRQELHVPAFMSCYNSTLNSTALYKLTTGDLQFTSSEKN
jgi:hypothetical protein